MDVILRKLNFAWLNALPRLRRVAQSSQVKKIQKRDIGLFFQAFFS